MNSSVDSIRYLSRAEGVIVFCHFIQCKQTTKRVTATRPQRSEGCLAPAAIQTKLFALDLLRGSDRISETTVGSTRLLTQSQASSRHLSGRFTPRHGQTKASEARFESDRRGTTTGMKGVIVLKRCSKQLAMGE